MAVTLDSVTFDESHTSIEEKLDEVGGRDEKEIEITGMIVGESTSADSHRATERPAANSSRYWHQTRK